MSDSVEAATATPTARSTVGAITRMRRHEPIRSYVARRTAEGLSKREILRCLKGYIACEVFAALPRPEPAPAGHAGTDEL